MKKKTVIALAFIIGALTSITGLGYTSSIPQTVYAQSVQQETANRNEVKVAVGDTTVNIVAYNVNGYNYFRVADLCKALNMKVFPYVNDLGDGVKIVSNEPFDGNVEMPPTEKRLNVRLKELNVYYDGGYVKAGCFNFGNRNYVKLADIVAAANNNYEIKLASVQKHSKTGTGQAITTRPTTIDLKTSFDGGTNTITISTTKTDFQKLYEELFTKEQGRMPDGSTGTVKQETLSKANAQPELSESPEVGTILAEIVIDASKPIYVNDNPKKGVHWDNITAPYSNPYSSGIMGSCVWYAEGRLDEVTGVSFPYGTDIYNLTDISKDPDFQVITDPNKIVGRSVAVFGTVHVLFVEYVERDEHGNPTYVYFTEGNTGHDNVYRPSHDGKVQKLEFSKFINRQATYKGCFTPK